MNCPFTRANKQRAAVSTEGGAVDVRRSFEEFDALVGGEREEMDVAFTAEEAVTLIVVMVINGDTIVNERMKNG